MRFIFEWKKYFTSQRSERVKPFFHEKINFIFSSQRIIFFLLHRYECFQNHIQCPKQRNDVSDTFTSEAYGKYVTRIPDVVSYEIYEWRILH